MTRTKASVSSEKSDATKIPPPNGLRAVRFHAGDAEYAVLAFPMEAAKPHVLLTLTESERQVTELTLKGLSNEEIATLRNVSHRTVANQLQAIYRKLGVGSRAELASAATQLDLSRSIAPGRAKQRRAR